MGSWISEIRFGKWWKKILEAFLNIDELASALAKCSSLLRRISFCFGYRLYDNRFYLELIWSINNLFNDVLIYILYLLAVIKQIVLYTFAENSSFSFFANSNLGIDWVSVAVLCDTHLLMITNKRYLIRLTVKDVKVNL